MDMRLSIVMDMNGRVLVSSNPLAIVIVCGISGFAKLAKVCDFIFANSFFFSHWRMPIG